MQLKFSFGILGLLLAGNLYCADDSGRPRATSTTERERLMQLAVGDVSEECEAILSTNQTLDRELKRAYGVDSSIISERLRGDIVSEFRWLLEWHDVTITDRENLALSLALLPSSRKQAALYLQGLTYRKGPLVPRVRDAVVVTLGDSLPAYVATVQTHRTQLTAAKALPQRAQPVLSAIDIGELASSSFKEVLEKAQIQLKRSDEFSPAGAGWLRCRHDLLIENGKMLDTLTKASGTR